jgi:hypothetical protein
MSTTFTSVDDTVLVKEVSQARHRLVFVAPGVRQPVAKALADAMSVLPPEAIHLVLDVDAEVCRLGYGDTDLAGLTLLQQAASAHRLTVNHHPGIRIGLLIADDTTLIYSPTPLLIEAESKQPDKPNAIVLHNEIPKQLADACAIGKHGHATLQIGGDPIDTRKVEEVKRDLQDRPPKEFNVARVERVFNSMLHYVEFRIEDYKLTSRSLLLNPELFGVRNSEVVRRLTNRYHLFSETDALTVEIPAFDADASPLPKKPKEKFGPLSIDRQRNGIKKRFIIEAGGYGLLILRRDVADFQKDIKVLEGKIAAYKETVKEHIKKRTDDIVTELLAALAERLKREPPDHWRSRFLGKQMSDDDLKRLFEEEVQGEVNRVKTDFNPRIFTAFKDVTYQTFKDPEFRKLLDTHFGAQAVERVFSEHDAAPEQPPQEPPQPKKSK